MTGGEAPGSGRRVGRLRAGRSHEDSSGTETDDSLYLFRNAGWEKGGLGGTAGRRTEPTAATELRTRGMRASRPAEGFASAAPALSTVAPLTPSSRHPLSTPHR